MNNWLEDLMTLENLAIYMAGLFTTCLYHIVMGHIRKQTVVIKWQIMFIPIALGLVAFLVADVQRNASCTREFNQAIRESRAVTSENDQLSVVHRELLSAKGRAETQMWRDALAPPDPEIAILKVDDPVRQEYSTNTVLKYADLAREIDGKILILEARQRWIIDRRPPLPDPMCGRD